MGQLQVVLWLTSLVNIVAKPTPLDFHKITFTDAVIKEGEESKTNHMNNIETKDNQDEKILMYRRYDIPTLTMIESQDDVDYRYEKEEIQPQALIQDTMTESYFHIPEGNNQQIESPMANSIENTNGNAERGIYHFETFDAMDAVVHKRQPTTTREVFYENIPETKVFYESPPKTEVFYEAPQETEVFYESLQEAEVLYETPQETKVFYETPQETEVFYEYPPETEKFHESQPIPYETQLETEVFYVTPPPKREVFYENVPESPYKTEIFYENPQERELSFETPGKSEVFYENSPKTEVFYETLPKTDLFFESVPETDVFYETPPETVVFYETQFETNEVYESQPEAETNMNLDSMTKLLMLKSPRVSNQETESQVTFKGSQITKTLPTSFSSKIKNSSTSVPAQLVLPSPPKPPAHPPEIPKTLQAVFKYKTLQQLQPPPIPTLQLPPFSTVDYKIVSFNQNIQPSNSTKDVFYKVNQATTENIQNSEIIRINYNPSIDDYTAPETDRNQPTKNALPPQDALISAFNGDEVATQDLGFYTTSEIYTPPFRNKSELENFDTFQSSYSANEIDEGHQYGTKITVSNTDRFSHTNYQPRNQETVKTNDFQIPILADDPLLNFLAYGTVFGLAINGLGANPFDVVNVELRNLREKRSYTDG